MDRYLNEKARDGIADDPTAPVLVVTPRQSTYGTEMQIQDMLDAPGNMGLEVVSMEEIAADILDSVYGAALEFVTTAGKSMLIRGILDRRREELTAFRPIAAAPELPAAIAKQITRLQQAGISVEELEQYAAAHPLRLRIRDLALIYADLSEQMEGRVDSDGALTLAVEYMEEAWFLDEALVIVRGFDEWSTQQIRFVEALIRKAPRVIIELPGVDEGEPDHALYRMSELARDRLMGAAAGSLSVHTVPAGPASDITSVACELFSHQHFRRRRGEAMEITSHADAEAEVRSVAAEIVRLHEEEGVAFGDMAIIWGETPDYEPLIRRIFGDANIPYFTGERKTLADSNIAEFVLTACELMSGPLSKEAVLAHAATGFTDLSSGELGQLVNYVRMMVSWGRELEKKFDVPKSLGRGFRDNVLEAERARSILMDPIMKELRPKGRTTDIFEALEGYVGRRLSEEKIESRAQGMKTEYEQVSFMLQSVEAILDLIRQAGQLLSSDMDGSELRRVLRAGFEAVELSLVPAALDEVQAGPLMRMYVQPVSHLFFVGVNDEVLPRFADPGGDLLTPAEWNSLVSDIKQFEPQSDSEAQKYRMVRAMLQADGQIHWSFHNGGEAQPSVVIEYLRQLYLSDSAGEDGLVPPETVRQRALRLKQNAYEEIVSEIRIAGDGGHAHIDTDLAAAVLFDPEFALRTSQLEDSLTRPNQAVVSPPRRPPRTFSATRLGTYGSCPYKHYVQHQLRVWTPPDVVVDRRASGLFMHGSLDGLARTAPGSWAQMPQEEFLGALRESMERERLRQIGEEPHPRNWARLDAVEPRLIEAALAMRAQQQEGLLSPLTTEVRFRLPFTDRFRLDGIIDRLDAATLEDGRYLSLVDYKMRDMGFSLRDLLLGTDVQLITYLLALEDLIANGSCFGGVQLYESDRIAGGGFLNLLPKSGKRPEDIRLAYRLSGLVAVRPEEAGELYGRSGPALLGFSHRIKGEGEYYKSAVKNFAPAADGTGAGDMETLLDCGRDILLGAMEGCAAGNNAISPARHGKTGTLACASCEFQSICRYEPSETPRAVRRLDGSDEELRAQIMGKYGKEKQS